jgi:hypothetical protein
MHTCTHTRKRNSHTALNIQCSAVHTLCTHSAFSTTQRIPALQHPALVCILVRHAPLATGPSQASKLTVLCCRHTHELQTIHRSHRSNASADLSLRMQPCSDQLHTSYTEHNVLPSFHSSHGLPCPASHTTVILYCSHALATHQLTTQSPPRRWPRP